MNCCFWNKVGQYAENNRPTGPERERGTAIGSVDFMEVCVWLGRPRAFRRGRMRKRGRSRSVIINGWLQLIAYATCWDTVRNTSWRSSTVTFIFSYKGWNPFRSHGHDSTARYPPRGQLQSRRYVPSKCDMFPAHSPKLTISSNVGWFLLSGEWIELKTRYTENEIRHTD